MANDPLAVGVSALVDKVTAGVGVVRERTIEIGSRVLWIDNIGSLVIVRGQGNYSLAIVGALAVLAGLFMLQSQVGAALLLIVIGIALIAISLSQKIENGLSIGTSDGRSTLIISTDEQFLRNTLDFLLHKIDSDNIALQGSFDVGSTHVTTSGGGLVVGNDGVALARGAAMREPTAPATPAIATAPAQTPPLWTPQFDTDAVGQSPSIASPSCSHYDQGADDSRPKGSPIAAIVTAALLALAAGGGFVWWQNAEAERRAWEAVSQQDPQALRDYVETHPSGKYHDQASAALYQLEEQRFQAAQASRDVGQLQTFLASFPGSQHSAAVNSEIADINREQAFLYSAPTLMFPASGSVFDFYPRTTILQWASLPGATRYEVQVEFFDPGSNQWAESSTAMTDVFVDTPSYTFDFVGAQPGRWRVRGIDAARNSSTFSDWWYFTYKR